MSLEMYVECSTLARSGGGAVQRHLHLNSIILRHALTSTSGNMNSHTLHEAVNRSTWFSRAPGCLILSPSLGSSQASVFILL